jgi:hypothetical protein
VIAPELDGEALATLRERVGELTPSSRVEDVESLELPPAEPLPPTLVEAVGANGVFASTEDRVRHATGRGYADLVRLRGRRLDPAPDAVLLPADADAAAAPASSAGSSRCAGRMLEWSASTSPACAAWRSTSARSPPASAPACAAPRPKRG